ncbi:aminotransferase class V-fold PLP-dependent enzyme [Marinitenerispora sediminis]|uniref:Cysteine desulfurase n=1 Tax=Marinitenerispora sediminis TaxID=1931232 RepID=A0A368TCF4_9ACTN|nr:aminotransferase class V-fold PLP-dependent enzyme [Marinitenerispora sediminis]RCV56655.1 cysteine desulfurase [Marinitenerispora sediminis]RCV61647.1 cysteine desulfurase [Marinitenerispora sediminis]RCV62621.1 cysteine desulfurase [Marinitenerispora sediminis]
MTAVADNPLPESAITPAAGEEAVGVVGADVRVPLVTGEWVEYANFDYAASAPCLTAVHRRLEEALPYYASVHRGAGFHSQVSTDAYERARRSVADFVGARQGDAVVFVRSTTDALNLLARSVPDGCTVVVFEAEHHASLLPWQHRGSRAGRVVRLPLPASPGEAVEAARSALGSAPEGPRLLCVTAASNVTGEIWPIEELTEVAHSAGARIVVDAAQLVPHRAFSLAATGADYVAFSGHKLYAPFGSGVLAGRTDWLRAAAPYLAGGGATANVTEDGVRWNDLPARHEAGSPNVLGAVTLAAACDVLSAADQERLHEREQALLRRLRDGLARIPGVHDLGLWGGDHPRVGIVSFVVDGLAADQLAAALSAEYGVGVRDGLFCAHLLTRRLLPSGHTQAVRASLGLGTTEEHVDRLVGAVAELATRGPRWNYELVDDRIAPVPDPRPRP